MADQENFNNTSINEEEVLQSVQSTIEEMKMYATQGAAVQSLKVGCAAFPVETASDATRKIIVDAFCFLLPLIEKAQIPNVLTVLDEEECTNLMRYLYKIMEIGGDKKACDSALAFHGALVAKFGPGMVARTLAPQIAKKLP